MMRVIPKNPSSTSTAIIPTPTTMPEPAAGRHSSGGSGSGSSSGGSVGLPSSGVGTINNLISPIFTLSGHDQLLAIAVDGLNVPCVKDTGFVLIDSTTTGYSATPVAADRDIDEFHCLIWGRTLPARFGTGHFQGSNA